MTENEIAKQIMDAAFLIHRTLGPGLLETVYEVILAKKLAEMGLVVDRQVSVHGWLASQHQGIDGWAHTPSRHSSSVHRSLSSQSAWVEHSSSEQPVAMHPIRTTSIVIAQRGMLASLHNAVRIKAILETGPWCVK